MKLNMLEWVLVNSLFSFECNNVIIHNNLFIQYFCQIKPTFSEESYYLPLCTYYKRSQKIVSILEYMVSWPKICIKTVFDIVRR